jgi:acyl carrier protein
MTVPVQAVDDIAGALKRFIYQKFPRARKQQAGPDENLLENRLIDSLGLLSIVTFIENTYRISVEDEDMTLDNFSTINAIARYVYRNTIEA